MQEVKSSRERHASALHLDAGDIALAATNDEKRVVDQQVLVERRITVHDSLIADAHPTLGDRATCLTLGLRETCGNEEVAG